MNDEQHTDLNWLDDLTERVPASGLLFMLDVIEPVAPVAAGVLWVVQPLVGTVINPLHLTQLAEHLDHAAGVAALRQHLEKHTS